MKWRSLDVVTLGDLSDVVVEIVASHDHDAANELMEAYIRHTPFAKTNLAYLSAAYDQSFGEEVRKTFTLSHPILGDHVSTIDRKLVEQVHLPIEEDFARFSSYKSS